MKEKLKKIIPSVKHLFSKVSYEKAVIRPGRDWQYMWMSFLLGIIVFGMCGLYVYFAVQSGSFWTITPADQLPLAHTINQKNLDKVSNYFGDKEKNFQSAENGGRVPSDPSL